MCQIEKLKKLTSERYGAMLELMSEQQPALYGFLKNMPHMNDWAEVVGEKNDHHTLGLAMWLAYKVKFGVLPKVEDQYIGVNVSVVFEASSFSSLIQGYCGRPELWYLAYSLLPFEMFINGFSGIPRVPGV